MGTKTVGYITKEPLPCGCTYGAGVVLCCSNNLTVPNGSGISPHYILASVQSSQFISNIVFEGYQYVFSYNDVQIKAGQALLPGSITGAFCRDCRAQYAEDLVAMVETPSSEPPSFSASTPLPLVTVDYTAITSAFASTAFLDGTQQVRWYRVNNSTNEVIYLSYDGVTDHQTVYPFDFLEVFPGGAYQFISATDIWLRSEGSAPLEGTVTLQGFY